MTTALSRDERVGRGKAARRSVTRAELGRWSESTERRDPVAVLTDQGARAAARPRPAPQQQICGWTSARAHARSGDRVAIAAYLGAGPAFDRAVAYFAESYADRNERDFEAFTRAAQEGPIEAGDATS